MELITGCSAMTMEVQLLDKEGKFLCILNNEDAMLGAYPVDENMRLHVGIFTRIIFVDVVLSSPLVILSHCVEY